MTGDKGPSSFGGSVWSVPLLNLDCWFPLTYVDVRTCGALHVLIFMGALPKGEVVLLLPESARLLLSYCLRSVDDKSGD